MHRASTLLILALAACTDGSANVAVRFAFSGGHPPDRLVVQAAEGASCGQTVTPDAAYELDSPTASLTFAAPYASEWRLLIHGFRGTARVVRHCVVVDAVGEPQTVSLENQPLQFAGTYGLTMTLRIDVPLGVRAALLLLDGFCRQTGADCELTGLVTSVLNGLPVPGELHTEQNKRRSTHVVAFTSDNVAPARTTFSGTVPDATQLHIGKHKIDIDLAPFVEAAVESVLAPDEAPFLQAILETIADILVGDIEVTGGQWTLTDRDGDGVVDSASGRADGTLSAAGLSLSVPLNWHVERTK